MRVIRDGPEVEAPELVRVLPRGLRLKGVERA
jgi:hypothetical protein